jgi:1,6-anhydro-N-acetylmuramate kinase
LEKLYLTGGGEKNRFVKKRLAEHLPGVTPVSIAELGIDPRYVESTAYAVMGANTLGGRPVRTVFVDSRPQTIQPVLGKIVQPPAKVRQ